MIMGITMFFLTKGINELMIQTLKQTLSEHANKGTNKHVKKQKNNE